MASANPRTHRKSTRSKSKRVKSSKKDRAAKKPAATPSLRREIYGVLVAAFTLLLTLSLVSHRPAAEEHNWIGQVGQVVAEGVFFLFGIGAFAVAAVSGFIAFWLLFGRKYTARPATVIGAMLFTLSLVTCLSVLLPAVEVWAVPLGGWVGTSIAGAIVGVLGRTGAVLILLALGLIGVILVTRASVVEVTSRVIERMHHTGGNLRIGDGFRGAVGTVSQGVAGLFSRGKSKDVPPLSSDEAAEVEDYYDEDTYLDTREDEAADTPEPPIVSAPQPEVRVAPAPQVQHPPSNEQLPAAEASVPAPIIRERAPAMSAAPVDVPSSGAEAPAAQPVVPSTPAAPARDASSVAERARRAIAAFRNEQSAAPSPPAPEPVAPQPEAPQPVAPPAPPRSDDGHNAVLPQPPRVDKTPRVPVAERIDHSIHNPMADTTRQNAALQPDDFEHDDSPIAPPPAPSPAVAPVPPAAPPKQVQPIIEPQRLSTDIGLEDVEPATDAPDDRPPVISRPAEVHFADVDDLQEQDTRPIQIVSEDTDSNAFHEAADAVSQSSVSASSEVSVQPSAVGQQSGVSEEQEAGQGSGPQIIESQAKKERFTSETMERALRLMEAQREKDAWTLPSLDMLSYEESSAEIDEDGLRAMATLLVEALADYKVKGRVTGICPGPVVTRFEFEPEPGTKLRRISGLSTDIAMRLRAENVRIIAPIPGKGCVGIEIPNDVRETVYLKEILADRRFTEAKSKISIALGKDIEGFPVVADLAKMPHLLVAGTTGSGKSVSINSMIMSVLYNASPDDVRMILIDPKQLEFALYEDIPHLLLPVVTDPSQAATALQWAVDEMERRYFLMKSLRVRNLEGYNEKLKLLQEEVDEQTRGGKRASKFALDALSKEDPDGRPTHRHMPYLIVVVDEFADLMMAAGKDVEIAVARIAQKARAAGIHCILATQRPSVDVLTGTIKSNFPTRISFRLISGTDSRTVIDTNGAEDLLGMGDMLYRPPGSSDLERVHGAFVDEDEIERVVTFVKEQREAQFDESILSAQVEAMERSEDVDPKYEEAVEIIVEAGYASISMVQRRLSVGYNRAANIVEEMERQGIVGPSGGGASRREVLI